MIEVNENKTTYIKENQILGEIDYPKVDESTVNINHTYVDPSLRGQGVADKMMESVFKYLNDKNKKVICTCSYAIKWLEKHPEYQDMEVAKKEN